MQANDDYILLLTKQVSGQITAEESEQLNVWLAQSPDHEQVARQFRLREVGAENFNHLAHPPVQVRLKLTTNRLDFRKLGHQPVLSEPRPGRWVGFSPGLPEIRPTRVFRRSVGLGPGV